MASQAQEQPSEGSLSTEQGQSAGAPSPSRSPSMPPAAATPLSRRQDRVSRIAGFFGWNRQSLRLDSGPEPNFRPDGPIEGFVTGFFYYHNKWSFFVDMALAIGPSLLAIANVFRVGRGTKRYYFDGCSAQTTVPGPTGSPVSAVYDIPLTACVECNGGLPYFTATYPETWRTIIIVFAILSSYSLAAATFALHKMRQRALFALSQGVYVSSSGTRNWLSGAFVSSYVIALALLQVTAIEGGHDPISVSGIGAGAHCDIPVVLGGSTSFVNATVTGNFSPGNPTTPAPVGVSPADAAAFVLFLFQLVFSQTLTTKGILEGPKDLTSPVTLRSALKKRNMMARVQAHAQWQVLAADLDPVALSTLSDLSVGERRRRVIGWCGRAFLPLTLVNYFSLGAASAGTYPFDRSYRKSEWDGRTVAEEIMHRLWTRKRLRAFRVRDDRDVFPPLPGPLDLGPASMMMGGDAATALKVVGGDTGANNTNNNHNDSGGNLFSVLEEDLEGVAMAEGGEGRADSYHGHEQGGDGSDDDRHHDDEDALDARHAEALATGVVPGGSMGMGMGRQRPSLLVMPDGRVSFVAPAAAEDIMWLHAAAADGAAASGSSATRARSIALRRQQQQQLAGSDNFNPLLFSGGTAGPAAPYQAMAQQPPAHGRMSTMLQMQQQQLFRRSARFSAAAVGQSVSHNPLTAVLSPIQGAASSSPATPVAAAATAE